MKITHSDDSSTQYLQWTQVTSSQPVNHSSHSEGRCELNFPRSRFHHGSCVQGSGLYVCGGKDRYSPLRDFWRLDLDTRVWEKLDTNDKKLPLLQGHTMVVHKSQILIYGGTFHDDKDETLWIYNTDLKLLRKFWCEPCSVQPRARREHSAVIHKNVMYVYGGFLDTSGSTDEFWAFHIEEEEWKLLPKRKPGKRHGHVAVSTANFMWLHAGMKELLALADLWNFHYVTQTWRKVKCLGVCPPLSGHSAHAMEDCMLVFGGMRNGQPTNGVWIFSFSTSTWQQVTTNHGDIFPPVSLHSSVLLLPTCAQTVPSTQCHSVPYLKRKSSVKRENSEEKIRPWTSPSADAMQSFMETSDNPIPHRVDILCLESLSTELDRNNNSEEDINHGNSEMAETSFCSPPTVEGEQQLRQRQMCRGRIRPASMEHCKDKFPLLERYQSVNSDLEQGANNLTLTLSDERLEQELIRTPSSFENGTYADVLKECEIELPSGKDRVAQIPDTRFSNWVSFDSISSLEDGNIHSVRDIFPLEEKEQVGIFYTTCEEKNMIDSFHPLSKKEGSTNSVLDRKCSGLVCDSQDSMWNRTKEMTGSHNFNRRTNQLVIEDLEFCDTSQSLHNIEITYPSTLSLKSCSLKDIFTSSEEKIAMTEPFKHPFGPSPRRRAKSCESISYFATRNLSGTTLHTSPKTRSKNWKNSCYSLKQESITERMTRYAKYTSNVSGKYIKHLSCASKSYLHASKARGNLHSQLRSKNTSIGTQTSTSLISLARPEKSKESEKPQLDHFVTERSRSSNIETGSVTQAVADVSIKKPDIKGTVKSHETLFSDTMYTLFIVGGQTNDPSFHIEPVKLWMCRFS